MRKQQFGAVLASVACVAGLVLASADNPASVRLIVPANAEVWFDGNRMSETGTVRDYVSPAALVAGSEYYYQVRVRSMKNGQPVDQTRKVIVRAGAVTTVDFTTQAAAQDTNAQGGVGERIQLRKNPTAEGVTAVETATGGSGELVGKVQGAGSPIAGATVTLYAASTASRCSWPRRKRATMATFKLNRRQPKGWRRKRCFTWWPGAARRRPARARGPTMRSP